MKKIILLCFILLGYTPAFAALEQGDHLIGGRVGLGFQLENSGISYSTYDDRVDWGTLGLEYGLSYYYFITDHIGLGADVSYGDFDGGELFVSVDKVDDETKIINTMLSARLTANPSSVFRLYIPLGIGVTTARQNMKIRVSGVHYEHAATDASLGWFAGAGFEFDLGRESGWSLGLEGRYNAFEFDNDKLVRDAPAAITGAGKRRLSYISLQLRVNKRF